MEATPDDLVLIGHTQKPYGLLGEMKVRPESFDLNRHASLRTVYFKKRPSDPPETLEIRATRAHEENWYLKFKGRPTPESVAALSGGMLFVPAEERLELPENMVYLSDMPGMTVEDETGREMGTVKEVLDGNPEILVVANSKKDLLIPWTDHFVKYVDKNARRVKTDLSGLRNLL